MYRQSEGYKLIYLTGASLNVRLVVRRGLLLQEDMSRQRQGRAYLVLQGLDPGWWRHGELQPHTEVRWSAVLP